MGTAADEAGVISARGVSGPSSTSQVSRHNRQSGSRSQNSLRMNLDEAFLAFHRRLENRHYCENVSWVLGSGGIQETMV